MAVRLPLQPPLPRDRTQFPVAFPRGPPTRKEAKPMQDNILQAIGKTPLVRLQRIAADVPAAVAVKVESQNPGGSVKDRVGLAMIVEAERRGWLRTGGTIIEATAGNTGV